MQWAATVSTVSETVLFLVISRKVCGSIPLITNIKQRRLVAAACLSQHKGSLGKDLTERLQLIENCELLVALVVVAALPSAVVGNE